LRRTVDGATIHPRFTRHFACIRTFSNSRFP
jgi:hypothetical protein